ncbi:MAG: asparagine synthase (glutamine-hydrolyzing) [Nitrosopumilaceae archaeon]
MCGIAGFFFRKDHHTAEKLGLMISQVRHRGPDGFGFYNDNLTGLAHARLSIIDLAGGNQPIHNEDQTVWCVFNGEIFNYIELRHLLEKLGHIFYTNSDTEVIVHLYEEYGVVRMMKHLRGQFAIALWDTKIKTGFLLRDRLGIRPLYYTQQNGTLFFASEVKSLFAIPELRTEISHQKLAEVFTFWTTLPPDTIFDGIKELPEGHYLVFDETYKIGIVKYWDHDFQLHRDVYSVDDYIEPLKELLIESIRLRLRADVPVGAYLSGGLDSSSIVALIKNYCTNDLRTFSIEFEDGDFNESAYQQEVVKMLDVNHTRFSCSYKDVVDNFPKAVWHAEKPMLRTAPVPMMLLSKMVRDSGYRVVLTGEGADETLMGYDIFREDKVRRFAQAYPNERDKLGAMLSTMYQWVEKDLAKLNAFRETFVRMSKDNPSIPYFSHIPRWRTTGATRNFFSSDTTQAINGFELNNFVKWLDISGINASDPSHSAQYIEYHTLLSGYLLSTQGDRPGMANAIEGRYPFLDHHFVEFCDKLPPEMKLNGMDEKYLLKCAMKELIPESVRMRKKQPYRAPDAISFFNQELPEYVTELLASDCISRYNYFNASGVAGLLAKLQAGKNITFKDDTAFVGILSTQLLHQQYVEDFQLCPPPTADEILINITR